MTTSAVPLFFPLRGTTALFGVPSAAGPPLECLSETATQLAGISVLQDPLGQYISGLQLFWYDATGAKIEGPVLETSPGTVPLVGSRSLAVPLASRMLQVEAAFSKNASLGTVYLEAIELTWLTQTGSARSAKVCCDYHVTQILDRETHRHVLNSCDIISGCSSYPNGAKHFPNLQMQLRRTPFAVQYSSFRQIGGPAICTWTSSKDNQLTIKAPRPPNPNADFLTGILPSAFQQRIRIFDDLDLPFYVSIFSSRPSEFSFSVANRTTGDVQNMTMRVSKSGLRGEELTEEVEVSQDFVANTDGVHDFLVQLSSYAISDAVVRGTCVATLYWVDFAGNVVESQVNANVTLDRILSQVGFNTTQSLK